MIPKVEFKVASIEHIISPINRFLNPKKGGWDWSRHILNRYPELDTKLRGIEQIEKRKEIAQNFFTEFLDNHHEELEKNSKLFQEEWNRINNKFMIALSNILDINWLKEDKKMTAYVSLNPICPRYIKKRTFDAYYNSGIDFMKSMAMHEILHFLWFEKWKQIFSKTPERHFDSPYLEWQLSEMVPKIILSDRKIQKIFPHNPEVYKEYLAMKINGKPLLSHIEELYQNKENINDFIRKSWAFVQKYKKEINKK